MRDNNNKGYHKLIVWRKSYDSVLLIYKLTDSLPKSEEYSLKSQTRRAAISVVLNIVEGNRRDSLKEYIHFLNIAQGSLVEVEACLELALGLKFVDSGKYEIAQQSIDEVGRLLTSFVKATKAKL